MSDQEDWEAHVREKAAEAAKKAREAEEAQERAAQEGRN